MPNAYHIVVGVDGSAGGRLALQWAVHQAVTRGGTVQAVTAYLTDDLTTSSGGVAAETQRANELLEHEVAALPAYQRSGVTIATEAVVGHPADVLTQAAHGAELLVLGSHGHGRLMHTVLGSVSEACIRKATCPVVVIPVAQAAPTGAAAPAVRVSDDRGENGGTAQ